MRAPHFHWFDVETVSQLRDQLNRAGDGARLEVHHVGEKMWLHVMPDGAVRDEGRAPTGFEPLNKSYICPPTCP